MNTTNSPTKPTIYIDASLLKESSCSRRLLYTAFYGFTNRSKHQNYQAGYGSAVHRALEFWYQQPFVFKDTATEHCKKKCIETAVDYYKPYTPYISDRPREFRTPTHLVKSLETYFSHYNVDTETLRPINGVLESKFVLPYYQCEDFDLNLSGTIDMIADYCGREVFVDHKTTSSYEKEKYFDEYKLSIQMMFYSYIVKRLTGRYLPCVINGIFLKKCSKEAEKSGEFDGVSFERSQLIEYSEEQMEEFEYWLNLKLISIRRWLEINIKEAKVKPQEVTEPNFAACQTRWGSCPYFSVCSVQPSLQDRVLNTMTIEHYNPLLFSE